ncbi:SOUL family heme-binding protein [Isachenkonia alkalipeptolytica]|uniref:Heme-binding protein n=1 Tax=Isachenkonia alkalipeptolytica TaxID=2565777 RepID=A0AA44BF57_9CLOT|nr:heme-binding protein [Isachenkonia alkalipeptolytica]NBG88845.1 heme-binding protein [Isachenkonia alkalipeptolytica]
MGYYERPEYEVLLSDKPFELRDYKEFFMVTYFSKEDPNSSEGFRTLFSYISSNNEENKKISMTVPVIEGKNQEGYRMSFVVPKRFGPNPPKPLDDRLTITKMEGGRYAVIQYRGTSNRKVEQEKEKRLREWMKKMDLPVEGRAKVAYFNPPFIPGVFKHNEVMIKV